MMPNLRSIYDTCFRALDGEKNDDIRWLLNGRPKEVSRRGFYQAFVWAVFVSGIKRDSAEKFLSRAEKVGFRWDYEQPTTWDDATWDSFLRQLYAGAAPGRRAKQKWAAIRYVAKALREMPDEQALRDSWFGGKQLSSELNRGDVLRLRDMGLPFVGPANAQYIVRNMGERPSSTTSG